MPLTLLLDSGVLSQLVRPEVDENKPIASAVFRLLEDPGNTILEMREEEGGTSALSSPP